MAKMSPEGREFVSDEISHLMKEGPSKGPQKGQKMPQDQAVAVALDVARRKGFKAPPNPNRDSFDAVGDGSDPNTIGKKWGPLGALDRQVHKPTVKPTTFRPPQASPTPKPKPKPWTPGMGSLGRKPSSFESTTRSRLRLVSEMESTAVLPPDSRKFKSLDDSKPDKPKFSTEVIPRPEKSEPKSPQKEEQAMSIFDTIVNESTSKSRFDEFVENTQPKSRFDDIVESSGKSMFDEFVESDENKSRFDDIVESKSPQAAQADRDDRIARTINLAEELIGIRTSVKDKK